MKEESFMTLAPSANANAMKRFFFTDDGTK
jgi:hypothetical protein